MKCKILLRIYLSLAVLVQFCSALSIEESIETLLPDEEACYYWNALHSPSSLEVPTVELREFLSGKPSAILEGQEFNRDVELALFIARESDSLLNSNQLQEWSKIALSPEGLSNQFVHEITWTLVKSVSVKSPVVEELFFADDIRVREAAFRAASVYGDDEYRFKLFEQFEHLEKEYQRKIQDAIQVAKSDYEQGQKLLQQVKLERKTDLSAYKELKDYIIYRSQAVADDLSESELLEWMGQRGVHKTASTSTRAYGGGGAFLWPSLPNLYWLERLNEVFKSVENHEERLKLEKAYRDGFYQSQPENLRHGISLFYLLGFELTAKEKGYLLSETSISENQLLPPGQIHLIGFDFIDSIAPTPTPQVVETVKEVMQTEPALEDPPKVKTPDIPDELAEQSSNWWLWLIGAVVVVVGILIVRRKS